MIRQNLAVLFLASAALAGCMTAEHSKSAAVKQTACADVNFPIYFRPNSALLTEPAIQAIRMAGTQSKGCKTAEVKVLGLADADGSVQANQALSEERAKVVGEALKAQGFPQPAIDVLAAGKQGATTASGAAAPQRRRAEVAISFKH